MFLRTIRRQIGRRSEAGFSVVETSIFLGTAAILASTIATVGLQSMETARGVVARDDVEQIASALGQLIIDRGNLQLTTLDDTEIQLLVGNAPIPDGPEHVLRRPIDGREVVSIDQVLHSNEIGLPEADGPWVQGWRGPYLQPGAHGDPWGRRYAVRLATRTQPALFVLSAGPNGVIDIDATGPSTADRGDDVFFLLSVSR